jgi:hypothetical protein
VHARLWAHLPFAGEDALIAGLPSRTGARRGC